jgi:hypothetical protein
MNSNDEPSLNLDLFSCALKPPTDKPLLERCKSGCAYVKSTPMEPARCRHCNHTFVR